MIFVVRVAQDKCMGTQSGDYRQIMTFPRQKKKKNTKKQTNKKTIALLVHWVVKVPHPFRPGSLGNTPVLKKP